MHTGSMKFRGILAGFLTAVLLSLSTVAAECQVKCGLGSMAPSCHKRESQATEHEAMPLMAAMEGMHHDNGVRSPAQTEEILAVNSACATHVCSQLPAKTTERKAVNYTLISVPAPFQAEFQLSPEPWLGELLSRGPPHLRETTPVSLRTSLRV